MSVWKKKETRSAWWPLCIRVVSFWHQSRVRVSNNVSADHHRCGHFVFKSLLIIIIAPHNCCWVFPAHKKSSVRPRWDNEMGNSHERIKHHFLANLVQKKWGWMKMEDVCKNMDYHDEQIWNSVFSLRQEIIQDAPSPSLWLWSSPRSHKTRRRLFGPVHPGEERVGFDVVHTPHTCPQSLQWIVLEQLRGRKTHGWNYAFGFHKNKQKPHFFYSCILIKLINNRELKWHFAAWHDTSTC